MKFARSKSALNESIPNPDNPSTNIKNPLNVSTDDINRTADVLEKATEMPELANGEHSRADLHEHLKSYGQWHLNGGEGRG
jgi:hypothetical protein